MEKLKLEKIKKIYDLGDTKVEALKEITLNFNQNEFVSILGPSGCGKTTLLNVIGGLDKYTRGDLIINGVSTRKYKDKDWDAYRNNQIGFVFQSYNLISHQTVLQNVEIALTLSGISKKERKRRARKVLNDVGLLDQINKKPNQLSGGQMQRVAIARALINNPSIILADEPTGALDSKTSVQIMEILKEISRTKLIIMVTHNQELADTYSNRIVQLLDGNIVSDNKKSTKEQDIEGNNNKKNKKTSMSWVTALSLSFRNLLTKRNRTIITSIAGSIGIIGVALVLSLSNGLTNYINKMQSESLAGFPVTVSTNEQNIDFTARNDILNENKSYEEYTDENVIYSYDRNSNSTNHKNIITEEYIEYVNEIKDNIPDSINNVSYIRAIELNLLTKNDGGVKLYDLSSNNNLFMYNNTFFEEMPDNEDFILSLYDLIGKNSKLPNEENEIAIVVDEYNRISSDFFDKLGITDEEYKLTDFIGKELLKVIPNNDFYVKSNNVYTKISADRYEEVYEKDTGIKLTVTGILRIKKNAASSYLSEGIVYTTKLTDYIVENSKNSEIAKYQNTVDYDVLTSLNFADSDAKEKRYLSLGILSQPTGINIYPKDFESKEKIKDYLDEYNLNKNEADQIIYTDLAETLSVSVGKLIATVTYVLVGFAAISLVVSTIMIGIITYVSVIERTKEIGILRSIGARKKDITRMFNAETLIIGFVSGLLGIIVSYLLTIPINKVIYNLVEIDNIASLNIFNALFLILGSMFLTLIAGFFPSRIAAKKDPVIALRTE